MKAVDSVVLFEINKTFLKREMNLYYAYLWRGLKDSLY